MRKEIIFAVIFGIAFGTVVALGFLRANKAIKESAAGISTNNNSASNETQKLTQTSGLTLIKPQDNEVVIDNPVVFSGLTRSGSYIVATNGENDEFIKTDNGSFELEFELEPAKNIIKINSLSDSGENQETSVAIVYSSEFSKQVDTGGDENSVDERLENAKKAYTFFGGTITDISNGSIQMKSDGQEIKYLAIDEGKTTFSKLTTKSQNIKYSDLAIGDYILALGYLDDKNVLVTLRILVTSVENPESVKVILGTVDDIGKSSISLRSSDDKIYQLTTSKSSKFTDGDINDPKKAIFSDIEIGSTVILTYGVTDENLIIRMLHIISYPEADTVNAN